MSDLNSIKASDANYFASTSEPKPTSDGDHMASKHPNELANRVVSTLAEMKDHRGTVNAYGLELAPGKPAPQFLFETVNGKLGAAPRTSLKP
jgi:hypothetical protein